MAGCSSSAGPHDDITVKWENGVISYNGKTLNVDSFDGLHATATTATGGRVTMQMEVVKDLGWLEWNTQGIEEMNMDTYKKGKWYSEFLGSKVTVAYPIEDGEIYAAGWTNVTGEINSDVSIVYDMLSVIPWTDGSISVDFGDFTMGADYATTSVRPDSAVITGICKVSLGSSSKCTTPYMTSSGKNEYTLYYYSDSKYTYYQYGDYLIQTGLGIPLEDYIHFK